MKKLFLINICLLATLFISFAQEKASTETLQIEGLKAPVEIIVDHWGIPHIYAQNEADLFFAQGFNAARGDESLP